MKKGTLLQTAAALAAACLVFFALALGLRWDLLLSAVLAVGVYVGLSLLLSPRRDRSARFFASRADGAELALPHLARRRAVGSVQLLEPLFGHARRGAEEEDLVAHGHG